MKNYLLKIVFGIVISTIFSNNIIAEGDASDVDTNKVSTESFIQSLASFEPIIGISDISTILPFHDVYQSWDTLNIFPYHFADLRLMQDTLPLVLNDFEDCGFAPPSDGYVISGFGYRSAPRFSYVVRSRKRGKKGRFASRGRYIKKRYVGFGSHVHQGVDIVLHVGDSVTAAWDGIVRISQYNVGGYGNCIIVRHYNGLETLYGHLSARNVHAGQYVKAGDLLGLGGSTGHSTGPHLHFETRYLGQAFDPTKIINFAENEGEGYVLKTDTLKLCKYTFGAPVPRYYSNRYASRMYKSKKGYASYTKGTAQFAYNGTHIINKGENLSKIAKRYGLSINKLCQLNNIQRDGKLSLGKKLKVK